MNLFASPDKVILCEGIADVRVIENLLRVRGITGFQVHLPKGGSSDTGGWTKFGRWLREIVVDPSFPKIRKFVVVADCDERPAARFRDIQGELRAAGWCGIPSAPLEVAQRAGVPDINVIMLPWPNQAGNLETLCLRAIYAKWPRLRWPLSCFVWLTPARSWGISKQSKSRIACLLSTTCASKPEATLHTLWQEDARYHFDLRHHCFDDLAEYLASL